MAGLQKVEWPHTISECITCQEYKEAKICGTWWTMGNSSDDQLRYMKCTYLDSAIQETTTLHDMHLNANFKMPHTNIDKVPPNPLEFLTPVKISLHPAEWQVMCVFKALHVNSNDRHSELKEAEFYNFYEVQNLKWREVSEQLWHAVCTACS